MESLIVNIDSRYRDYIKYPSENKFSINLGRNYKNIKAIKLLSIELNNTISYMDSIKKNNFMTIHLPSKEQDDVGYKIVLPDGLWLTFTEIQKELNILFMPLNRTSSLELISSDRYYYFFNTISITNISIIVTGIKIGQKQSLTNTINLTLPSGTYTLYGLNRIICNTINSSYTTTSNINTNFTLNIYDIRSLNNTRSDIINYNGILSGFKQYLYSTYNTILANNKYCITNTITSPVIDSIQLYNFNISMSINTEKINIYSNMMNLTLYNSSTQSMVVNDINMFPSFEFNFEIDSQYHSLGYYLGYRKLVQSSKLLQLLSEKVSDFNGYMYFFIKINEWGDIDLFNKKMVAKILTDSTERMRMDYIESEYKFKQPTNIQTLNIELIDYLGNPLNLNGADYSFTLQLYEIYISDLKHNLEYNFLVDKSK
jgi:hypothetical protein